MKIIEINKLSSLHNGESIIFCKTDFLDDEFQHISNLKNDVILITGNSDYPIDEYRFNKKPKNIKKWFAQNALVNDIDLIPIPIGFENKLPALRDGHGIGYYDRAKLKEDLVFRNLEVEPNKKIYANFNVLTNYHYRNMVRDVCIKSNYIDWDEPNLSLEEFFDKILEYEMVVCPIGNGIDTHRLWEVLYSNRIPITIRVGNFKIYELYEKLPIIILDNENDLYNEKLLDNKLNEIKNKQFDKNIINLEFWVSQILNTAIK
jgi:hypothetical protein